MSFDLRIVQLEGLGGRFFCLEGSLLRRGPAHLLTASPDSGQTRPGRRIVRILLQGQIEIPLRRVVALLGQHFAVMNGLEIGLVGFGTDGPGFGQLSLLARQQLKG